MRLATHDGTIVTLKLFRFTHAHYLILCHMQADSTLCNCLIEIEGDGSMAEFHKFIPVHRLDLEDFMKASLLNLPLS